MNENITRTLIWSASRYTTVQRCFYAADLHYNKRILPIDKAEPLERGSLIDTMCNVYYNELKNNIPKSEALADAIEKGRFTAVKSKLEVSKTEFIIERFIQYVHHYLSESWTILEVQAPFTKILFESEEDNLRIVGEGLIDLLVSDRAGNFLVVDTKSSSRQADERKINAQKLDNQFKLYATVFNVHQICVNEIGMQKGKNEDNLFNRRLINFQQVILDEWLVNMVYWSLNWLEHKENNLFPKNDSSCYGCDYNKICIEQPDMRQFIINRDYKVTTGDFDIYKKEL